MGAAEYLDDQHLISATANNAKWGRWDNLSLAREAGRTTVWLSSVSAHVARGGVGVNGGEVIGVRRWEADGWA
eukprot:1041446-Prymnesium_polylepis.2